MGNPYTKKKRIHIDGKVRLNLRIPIDLDTWLKGYAKRKNATVTSLILQHFGAIKKAEEEGYVEQV